MNQYLMALVGLVAMLVVGFVVYGLAYKARLAGDHSIEPMKLVPSLIAMYVIAVAFIRLFSDVSFTSGTSGVTKGLYLGAIFGLAGFVLPLFADRAWLKSDSWRPGMLMLNWFLSFLALGAVVGLLA